MLVLLSVLIATIVVAGASIYLAAHLSFRLVSKVLERMVSFSIGILLATAFLHLLPEAFESNLGHRTLFSLLLAAVLTFFFLEKVALYRHSHHFEGDGHEHEHGHDAREAGHGGALVLLGSAVHNASDGILIAGAFLAGPSVGLATALSIFAHEVPHKIGDFVVLLNAGLSQTRAMAYAALASGFIVIGGVGGYFFLERLQAVIPYVLVIAAGSFVYIALSDLVPRVQRGTRLSDATTQAVLIALGIAAVLVMNRFTD